MSESQSAHQSIPFLKSNEEQIGKIRRQLEGVFRELDLVHDVIVVCDIAAHAEINIASHGDVDLGDAVPHVIRRCATNRLYTAMKALTQIVERFGGKTAMSHQVPAELCRQRQLRRTQGFVGQRRTSANDSDNNARTARRAQ
nr:hypothetical protein [Peristeroidobacter agariperforans]